MKAEAGTPFKAHRSEIELARAKCGPGATDAALIESIKARHIWEATHQSEIAEAVSGAPKASHGRPVSSRLSEPAQRPHLTGRNVELTEGDNPNMCSLADMGWPPK